MGPAIAVMWGWLPALLWVFFGAILIGAVHDFGSLIVSIRNRGQTVGDIAGRVMNKRVRLLFLFILFMATDDRVGDLWPRHRRRVQTISGFDLSLSCANSDRGRRSVSCFIAAVFGLLWPSIVALVVMYLTVIYGNDGLAR